MSSKKQKEIVAKNIKRLLESRGKTQTDMAKDLNFPEMTVSNWMRAVTYPRIDKIQAMADYFGVYRSEITEDEEDADVVAESAVSYGIRSAEYNYYPVAVAAGLPDNIDAVTNTDKITLPDAIMGKWAGSKDIFIMRIAGESMNKTIPDGSLIAVKSIELANLKSGDIVVYSDGNDYSVKRFYQHDDKIIFRPHSTDTRFTDYIVSTDNTELKIHGKVVVYIVEMD